MVILGQLADLPAILEALNPSGSIEGSGQSIRLDDPPGAVSADGRCAWVDGRWGEAEREWFTVRGAGLVEVRDGVPEGWYPAVVEGE